MAQVELFEKKKAKKDDNQIPIGNGYTIKWINEKTLGIERYGIPYKIVEINTAIDRRRLVVELVLEAGVKRYKLAEALKISRQSINNWIDTFKKAGFEGLVNSYRGSRRTGGKEEAARGRLPTDNKARQLEDERKARREALQKQQLQLEVDSEEESHDTVDKADLFNDKHDFKESRYAGAFLYWGIFQHFFGFMQTCESVLGKAHAVVIYLFAMMLVCGIKSIEQLKTVYKREFGRVIGLKELFSKPVIWKKVHEACSLNVSNLLIEEFFRQQAQKGLVFLYWLYIDGHFIPYYGKEDIHKGYYTQGDQMMPGQTEMYVHDSRARIVYFELAEGKGDIKEICRRMSKKWSVYMGGTAPLIVADREVWGVEHFLEMKGYRFLTWEKFSNPESLSAIPDKSFSEPFELNGKEYQVFEEKKRYQDKANHSIELRRIIIWNKKTDKRVACVAQDDLEDTVSLAMAMLGRWGCSENAFKYIGARFNMHYNPVIEASEESSLQEMANPQYERLKKKVVELKKNLTMCEGELGRLRLTTNKDGLLRKSKKRERLQKERVDIKEQLATAKDALESCPERINLKTTNPDKTFKKLSTEGKNLWDLAQSLVWNSRKKLLEIFSQFLPNSRDLIPALEAITNCRGWVKSTSEVIEVRLEAMETPRFKAGQMQLCRSLNQMNIRLNNSKRLLYDVGPDPKNVQNNNP
ncbi:MAG: putative transposase [Nitrospirota bacterium]